MYFWLENVLDIDFPGHESAHIREKLLVIFCHNHLSSNERVFSSSNNRNLELFLFRERNKNSGLLESREIYLIRWWTVAEDYLCFFYLIK